MHVGSTQSIGAGAAARVPLRQQYIGSPVFDWLFLIGSPLLAVAVVLGGARLLPSDRVEYYVLTFMALGHHVPTFLRAYGDPDEFARNRFQLLVVPLCILPIVIGLVLVDARLLALIFVWDQYHFARQHYGFMRIYDVKAGATSPFDTKLDQWFCYSSFVAILAHSGFYGFMFADTFYDFGVAFPAWLVESIEHGSLAVAIVVGAAYAARLQWRVAHGLPVAWLKLAISASSLGVWLYAYVILSDAFQSYAISSFFHCLQYDAFAWHYNRRKARSLEPTRGNALFRRIHEIRQLWLYALVILSYGAFSSTGKEAWMPLVLALNTTTGLLHYYFDSFIWRVRRAEFQKHL